MDYQNIAMDTKKRIILDESALLPRSFLDAHLRQRDSKSERILAAINRLSINNPSENLFIHGPAGCGKTTVVKRAIELAQTDHQLMCIYANCWHYSTSMSIYTKIADAFGEPVSRRGRASDEIFDCIIDMVKSSKKPVLLVLDEIEALIRYDEGRILSNIASIDDDRFIFGIITISDKEYSLSKLPQVTREILRFTNIKIPSCARDELLAILKGRAAAGLRSGTYDDSILEEIADIGSAANGNARLAIEILWRAARSSEEQGLETVARDELDRARVNLEMDDARLSREEKTIIAVVEDGEIHSSRLYKLLSRKIPKTKRQIRNYLRTLEERGIIESQLIKGKYNYGSTIIRLREGWGHVQ